jgi:cell division transport system permease protein
MEAEVFKEIQTLAPVKKATYISREMASKKRKKVWELIVMRF